MKLEQMFPDFGKMSEEQQVLFVRSYRARRATELVQMPTKPGRKRTTNDTMKLSPEDMALLKKFGISTKTLNNLQPEDPEEDEGSFEFNDDYSLNEEEGS